MDRRDKEKIIDSLRGSQKIIEKISNKMYKEGYEVNEGGEIDGLHATATLLEDLINSYKFSDWDLFHVQQRAIRKFVKDYL